MMEAAAGLEDEEVAALRQSLRSGLQLDSSRPVPSKTPVRSLCSAACLSVDSVQPAAQI